MTALAVSVASVNAIVLNFDALPSTDLSFNGTGNFDFTSNSSGDQFQITTVQQGTGAAVDLEGYLAGTDLFTIGSITDSGLVQTAPVTGTATLYIVDQNNIDLTGTLQWNDISTTFSTIGGVNYTGSVNLSDIQYSGTNADLLSLAAAGSASDVLSFEFTSPESLSNLVSTATSTSYSGSFSAGTSLVPEPGSAVVLLAGLACFYGVLRYRKVKESRNVCPVKIETRHRRRPSK
jgi:hypothetical protein